MAELSFNSVLMIESEQMNLKGYFRVVVDSPEMLLFLVAELPKEATDDHRVPSEEKTTLASRKAKPNKHLVWVARADLEQAAVDYLLRNIELKPERRRPATSAALAGRHAAFFQLAKVAGAPLWDRQALSTAFLRRGGLSALVKQICEKSVVSRSTVYQWFFLLCRDGFCADSLRPRLHHCGAPGVARPWGEGSRSATEPGRPLRKKPGRKSDKSRDPAHPERLVEASGWTQQQERRFIIELRRLLGPQTNFSKAYAQAISAAFSSSFRIEQGIAIPDLPPVGSYPGRRAARRIYKNYEGDLERLRRSTTAGNFLLNHRGLVGRSYKGAAGPGYRYMADATRGNVYLRSSINLAWIIGRPIVYLLVDVWSTAVVGFHVCLEGPSWATAQVALYTAFSAPEISGQVWGISYATGLCPNPTVCYELYVDRGEFFTDRARNAAASIGWKHCILPSARADLKGWGEVLHRIVEKDAFYPFVPGAINARRKEYQLRTFNPSSAVLTLKQYAELLALEIEHYNLSADRRHRVTQEMSAIGVVPTPAGLWRFGHQIGIGYRKSVDQHKLVTEFLPRMDLHITRQGAMLGRLLYHHPVLQTHGWAARARNFGAFTVDSHIHSASLKSIWVPDSTLGELHEFSLSTEAVAKPETSLEEYLDWNVIKNFGNADLERLRLERETKTNARRQAIIAKAVEAVKVADVSYCGEMPSLTEARQMEKALNPSLTTPPAQVAAKNPNAAPSAEVLSLPNHDERYLQMLRDGLKVQFATVDGT